MKRNFFKSLKGIANFAIKKVLGSIAAFLYFASYPLLAFAFSSNGHALILSIAIWLLLLISAVYITVLKSDYDFRKAFRTLFRITLIPLVIFILFNIGITAHYMLIIKQAASQVVDYNNATRLLLGMSYTRYISLIPRLWITALLYAFMSLLFYLLGMIARRKQLQGA